MRLLLIRENSLYAISSSAAGVRPAVGFLEKSEIEVERGIKVNSKMETNVPNVYAAGDVTGLSGIWPNAMKQGQTAARNMCGVGTEYTDTFAAKNTINFFGLVTLCLGRIRQEEGDEIFVEEDRNVYRRLIMKDGVPEGILLQGDIAHSGIWQYMIKSKIDISSMKNKIFKITFADFYGIGDRGKYVWKIDEKMDKKRRIKADKQQTQVNKTIIEYYIRIIAEIFAKFFRRSL